MKEFLLFPNEVYSHVCSLLLLFMCIVKLQLLALSNAWRIKEFILKHICYSFNCRIYIYIVYALRNPTTKKDQWRAKWTFGKFLTWFSGQNYYIWTFIVPPPSLSLFANSHTGESEEILHSSAKAETVSPVVMKMSLMVFYIGIRKNKNIF